ncbi:C6 transcription factor [Stagonosporopsis vannaccii]|nr:C6 transcription factor [Stagonosporopsis vannaccii]
MPKKRYHKKSRTGCDTCKRRRVKCDEVTPICGNCAQRQDPCHYSRATSAITTARSKRQTTSPPEHIVFLPSNPLLDVYAAPSSRLTSYTATRMKELQLMHQWSTVTYLTSGPRNMEVFRDYSVRKALEYPYLMDILLAFTSLHNASEATGAADAYEHVTAALYFQNQSIAELNRRESLLHVSQETYEPVFLVTALNGVCTLLASMVPAASGEQLESIPQVMLRVRKCMLGVKEVFEYCNGWTQESELARIFSTPLAPRIEDGGLSTLDTVRSLSDAVLANVDLDDAATSFFCDTLQKMEKAYADNNRRSVFGWLVMVEAEFFHKVGLGETAAMVILVCWGALTFVLEEVWWTKYAGRRIVEDLSVQLAGCDSKWDEVLQWCYGQVGILGKGQKTTANSEEQTDRPPQNENICN